MKTYKIKGKFDEREDVEIEITQTVQKLEVKTMTVEKIEERLEYVISEIENITLQLANLQAEKISLEGTLADNASDITKAIK